MKTLIFNGRSYTCQPGASVLDILLVHGQSVNWSCRSGFCHSCLMQSCDKKPPARAQNGLNNEQVKANLFLACQLVPEEDIIVAGYRREYLPVKAVIVAKKQLVNACILTIQTYHPVVIKEDEALMVCSDKQSLCTRLSLSDIEYYQGSKNLIVLSLKKNNNGDEFSLWLYDQAEKGEVIFIKVVSLLQSGLSSDSSK